MTDEWVAEIEKLKFKIGRVEVQHSVEAEQFIARFYPHDMTELSKLAMLFFRKCWDKKLTFGAIINKSGSGNHPPYTIINCPYDDCVVCEYVRQGYQT